MVEHSFFNQAQTVIDVSCIWEPVATAKSKVCWKCCSQCVSVIAFEKVGDGESVGLISCWRHVPHQNLYYEHIGLVLMTRTSGLTLCLPPHLFGVSIGGW